MDALDTSTVIELANLQGIEDKEALWILEFGARSHSHPPLNSVFFPNHAGALANAIGMESILEKELDCKWMRASRHPPFVPIGVRPVSLVPKTRVTDGAIEIYGYRLITDGSFPAKNMRNCSVEERTGGRRMLAPNLNYVEGSQPWLHYLSIPEISQGAMPLLALAREAGLQCSANALISKSGFGK
jgi:hypothetical protein